DLFIGLFLLGRLPRFLRTSAAALLLAPTLFAPEVRAQGRDDPTLVVRLAYVRTGDSRTDRTSAAGLEALTQTLVNRTSVEPGAPIGVDLGRDNLAAYPFLYWAAPSSPQRLSDAALANVDHYLAIGGLLLVDTRDAGRAANAGGRPAQL